MPRVHSPNVLSSDCFLAANRLLSFLGGSNETLDSAYMVCHRFISRHHGTGRYLRVDRRQRQWDVGPINHALSRRGGCLRGAKRQSFFPRPDAGLFACGKLQNAILNSTTLVNADLLSANLTGASLSNANLTQAELGSATLTNANLRGANLTNAQLYNGATLTGADLTNATITGVGFQVSPPSRFALRPVIRQKTSRGSPSARVPIWLVSASPASISPMPASMST